MSSHFSFDEFIHTRIYNIYRMFFLEASDGYPAGLYIDDEWCINYLFNHKCLVDRFDSFYELPDIYVGNFKFDEMAYPVFQVVFRMDLETQEVRKL